LISIAGVIDGAILVIDANKGIEQQTRQHIKIVRNFSVKHIVAFIHQTQSVDSNILENIENELRILLDFDKNSDDFLPIIHSKSFPQIEPKIIDQLLHAIDVIIPSPNRDTDKPPLMSIMDRQQISAKDKPIVVKGVLHKGTIRQGDRIDVAGYGNIIPTIVKKIKRSNQQIDHAQHGNYISLLLQDLTKKQIRRGLILSLTNTSTLHQRFTAKIYVLNQEQGGRHTPFFQTYQPQIHSRTCSVRTKLTFPQTIQKVMPGDKVELTFQLCKSIVIQQDDPIFICEGHQLIATGTVLQILD